MKVKLRRGCQNDIDNVFDLHLKCFIPTDCWYKSAIRPYLDKSILIEVIETKQIIGILLQGFITPCNKKINIDETNNTLNDTLNEPLKEQISFKLADEKQSVSLSTPSEYKEDIFEPINIDGEQFCKKNFQYKQMFGIMMICIDSKFRGNGLAKKLIDKHFKDNSNKTICLNTRRSNINAYRLYQSMGYNHIAFIKNKYFLPTEDSIFMIKDLT